MSEETLLEESPLDWDSIGRKLLPGDGPKQVIVDYPKNPKIIQINIHSPFGNPRSQPIPITKEAVDELLQRQFLRRDKVGTTRRRTIMTLTQSGKVYFKTYDNVGTPFQANLWRESPLRFSTRRRF